MSEVVSWPQGRKSTGRFEIKTRARRSEKTKISSTLKLISKKEWYMFRETSTNTIRDLPFVAGLVLGQANAPGSFEGVHE